ncbi:hypothetical protein [Rhizobium sp. PP-CC-3G-465]|uniref:hypothetical protein n=1 Tax=Rhizobium sp. PP-CC-3G-465 TaxID=2135648 RepID=UPI0010D96D63|nr:hypothetical protein C8J33_1221 [Rhizobium sp. PP-CC-3G-465]
MKTLVTFCQKTGRRLRQFINRQIAKLAHKGQLKFSIAIMLRMPPPKAVCPDFVIGFKSMPYVMRYNHFPY